MITAKIVIAAFAGLTSVFFWGIAFAILYHLSRFGIGVQPKRFAAMYLFGSVALYAAFIVAFGILYSNPPSL